MRGNISRLSSRKVRRRRRKESPQHIESDTLPMNFHINQIKCLSFINQFILLYMVQKKKIPIILQLRRSWFTIFSVRRSLVTYELGALHSFYVSLLNSPCAFIGVRRQTVLRSLCLLCAYEYENLDENGI